jgi:uncharacterized protein YPO0396
MQLSVFSTDSHKSGFRLQYMEVFNWGTFDEHVHSIKPMGETSLLTGANGSGKTTFVDALLTLIVPEKRYRFYNQSSGSEKKGDRTEESYVLGGFGTVNSDVTGGIKTQYLRESKEQAFSIILAAFRNEQEQEVTLFQVRYFSNGDMKRYYSVAHKLLHIESDFKPFDLNGNWKKRIDQQYNKAAKRHVEWLDSAGKYAQRLVEVLGMQSLQALSLFNQTVGIKVLGNLDEFIRTHMLEPRDMEKKFQELKEQLKTLMDAQLNIEKAEAQIKLLEPLKEHFENYNRLRSESERLSEELKTANIWKSYTISSILKKTIEENEQQLKELEGKLVELKKEVEHLIEKERETKNLIDSNKAGQELKTLTADLEKLIEKKKEAAANLDLFVRWCNDLSLKENSIAAEADYTRVKREAERIALSLNTENRNNEEDEFEAKTISRKAEEEKKRIEEELNVLVAGKSNIPSYLISIRKEICSALKIDISDLPFAGELIQVAPEEIAWQPALEKLLHSFSLRLLVPDKFYKKVTRHINQTNLRGRLVYYHVRDLFPQHAEDGTVFHKLEFNPDHKLTDWVRQSIIQQYSYSCVNDDKELELYDKAITINELIKNKDRHEKDDRPDRNDPSRYVMGWNNERKREALMQKRGEWDRKLRDANAILLSCRRKSERIKTKLYAAQRIQEHEGFNQLNVNGWQQSIHKTEIRIVKLRESNNELKALAEQLDEYIEERKDKEKKREGVSGETVLLKSSIQQQTNQLAGLDVITTLIREADKDKLLDFQQKHLAVLQELTLEKVEQFYESFNSSTSTQIEKINNESVAEERKVNRCIGMIKNPSIDVLQRYPGWVADVEQLSDDSQFALEYIEWLDKLMSENLPKYRKDFETYIKVTVTHKLGGLKEELDRWEKDINDSVGKLNQSLGAINFNKLPDTYIQLDKRPVRSGSEIKEFRNALLEALPQQADWQQSSFESKSIHFKEKVQPLIAQLDENENYRNKVMDVRNWFEFWAEEKFRNTNELRKTYWQMGQLSGGEKAQLTYTILCSAIAYQFGITREGKNVKSLRFIAVDESFSNQDEDKARYLMELCKQLHLQLLVVTPSDKIQIVQDYIAHVHLVQRVNGRNSIMHNMTIKELKERMEDNE